MNIESPVEYLQKLINERLKEANTMNVSYKGITGELVKLERVPVPVPDFESFCSCASKTVEKQPTYLWDMEIFEREKCCEVSFKGIPLKDVKFLGGEVTYG